MRGADFSSGLKPSPRIVRASVNASDLESAKCFAIAVNRSLPSTELMAGSSPQNAMSLCSESIASKSSRASAYRLAIPSISCSISFTDLFEVRSAAFDACFARSTRSANPVSRATAWPNCDVEPTERNGNRAGMDVAMRHAIGSTPSVLKSGPVQVLGGRRELRGFSASVGSPSIWRIRSER